MHPYIKVNQFLSIVIFIISRAPTYDDKRRSARNLFFLGYHAAQFIVRTIQQAFRTNGRQDPSSLLWQLEELSYRKSWAESPSCLSNRMSECRHDLMHMYVRVLVSAQVPPSPPPLTIVCRSKPHSKVRSTRHIPPITHHRPARSPNHSERNQISSLR